MNIGISQYDDEPVDDNDSEGEEQKLESAYLDPSLKVDGRKRAPDGGNNRMFKLKVTDGLHTF